MLTRRDHLFLKLAEECNEVAQRVSKLLQFGPGEIQTGQPLTNEQRLRGEVDDMLAVLWMLQEAGHLSSPIDLDAKFATKKAKIEKYLQLSIGLGCVEP